MKRGRDVGGVNSMMGASPRPPRWTAGNLGCTWAQCGRYDTTTVTRNNVCAHSIRNVGVMWANSLCAHRVLGYRQRAQRGRYVGDVLRMASDPPRSLRCLAGSVCGPWA